jgi:hypothetical protein
MKWGSYSDGVFTEKDDMGKEVWIQFAGLPPDNEAFGGPDGSPTKTVTMSVLGTSQEESNPIQVFFTRDATNHPGGEVGSRNWYYYWLDAYNPSPGTATLYEPQGNSNAEVKGMVEWNYEALSDKVTCYMHDGSSFWIWPTGSLEPLEGMDCFYNLILHEAEHVSQIDRADDVVGLVPDTCWRYGWSWNQPSHNHWSVGEDGQPGRAGVDDDGDGQVDNQRIDGPGEMGAQGSDDVRLCDETYPAWPLAFGTPPPGGNPIEIQADERMTIPKNYYWTLDWGNPGKQHKTNRKYDN